MDPETQYQGPTIRDSGGTLRTCNGINANLNVVVGQDGNNYVCTQTGRMPNVYQWVVYYPV